MRSSSASLPGAAVFAALLIVGVLRTRRGGIGGPILIAALCVFEIANAPSWPRDTVGDWISKTGFAVVAPRDFSSRSA